MLLLMALDFFLFFLVLWIDSFIVFFHILWWLINLHMFFTIIDIQTNVLVFVIIMLQFKLNWKLSISTNTWRTQWLKGHDNSNKDEDINSPLHYWFCRRIVWSFSLFLSTSMSFHFFKENGLCPPPLILFLLTFIKDVISCV